MISLSVLPASYGDCIWIEYGDPAAPRVILIDGGPTVPAPLKVRLNALKNRGGRIELAVVTHIDADHIAGMLTLLKNDFDGIPVDDLWFNGFRHLPDSKTEEFGPKQGERLTDLLVAKNDKFPWNRAFAGRRIAIDDHPNFEPIMLQGGARITLLSPDHNELFALRQEWIKVCGEADLYPDLIPATESSPTGNEVFGVGMPDVDTLAEKKFVEDNAPANGSSIAFVLEYAGKRVLFGADAHPSRLLDSLKKCSPNGPARFDAVKLPHHGSENNVSKELIQALETPVYIFSSDGAKFKHPRLEAVARVVKYGKQPLLAFNYRSTFNDIWDDALLKGQWLYQAEFGDQDGYRLKL